MQFSDCERLAAALKTERTPFEPHWRDLADFILPRRLRLQVTDRNKDRRNNKIIDATATLAVRTMRSGMMSGITSPARPWFRLSVPDSDLAEWGPAKHWLYAVTERMRTAFLRSNLYTALPVLYGDGGVFGTGALSCMEYGEGDLIFQTWPVGSYWIASNSEGRADLVYREFQWTARQAVQEFGDKVSAHIESMAKTGDGQAPVTICHMVYPNDAYDERKMESRNKRYRSVYWEAANHGSQFLRESGFDEFPVLVNRWDVTGEDDYGSSPGMDVLGDVKALQMYERRVAQAVEKTVNPPMVADVALQHQKASIVAGDVTYVDATKGDAAFRPAYRVDFRIQEAEAKAEQCRQRIRRAFYEDLFLMLAISDRRQITAREIDERHEEKLLMLGPVLERLNDEVLDPLIDRAFGILYRNGQIPPPPEELEGVPLKVEYVSLMAQAQKLVGIGAIDRFARYVGGLAAGYPEALDKLDADQSIDEYAEILGVPPQIVRTDEQVAEIRERRAQQQQAMQRAAMAKEMVAGAKTLSETQLDTGSALDRVMEG